MTIINSFVKFVIFVVKKWDVGGITIKNSVVEYSGVELCRLCGLIFLQKNKKLTVDNINILPFCFGNYIIKSEYIQIRSK